MGFKIIWTDSAVSDLEGVFYYIAGDNPEAARSVAREIVDHVEILATFPFIGLPIREALEEHFGILLFGPIESFTTLTRTAKASRSFISGMVLAKSQRSDRIPRHLS